MTTTVGVESLAMAAFERAYDLEQARYALKYESVHGASTLTDLQREQRSALLKICEQILVNARNREMDAAVAHWQAYRSMTQNG